MSQYKINTIYNSKENINDIFIKVLLKELQKICKNISSSCTYLSLKEGGKH